MHTSTGSEPVPSQRWSATRPASVLAVEPAVDAADVARELRHGLEANELRLHYQPILSLATGRPVGVEALVRWQHPARGLLAPGSFMPVAERTDLVLPLGAWVLHEACRFAAALPPLGAEPLTVAVNLSGRQLSDPALVDTVRACLDAQGCDAGRLVLEVTETALVTDLHMACTSLRELTAMGAGVAIDDFGTGYSSLLYLKNLPASDLKIDRAFISGIGIDHHDTAIVASLITLAHNLDVRCIAEGVETEQQRDLLIQLGCDLAQGFLFSRAVDAPSMGTWLGQQVSSGIPRQQWVTRSAEVPRILAMHDSGCSVHTIAAALNGEGSVTAAGLRWSARSVGRIVSSCRLSGVSA